MSLDNKADKAVETTQYSNTYAIFYREGTCRIAMKKVHDSLYLTFREKDGLWEKQDESLYTWCLWNAEYQGCDDISSLITE